MAAGDTGGVVVGGRHRQAARGVHPQRAPAAGSPALRRSVMQRRRRERGIVIGEWPNMRLVFSCVPKVEWVPHWSCWGCLVEVPLLGSGHEFDSHANRGIELINVQVFRAAMRSIYVI